MRNMIFCLLAVLFLSSNVFAQEKEYDPSNTVQAINQAALSIHRVEREPSKATVDEEYNNIINNFAVGNITDDYELRELFKGMMDAYTENRLDSKERDMLQRQYETQVNKALLQVKPLEHVKKEVRARTAQNLTNAVASGSLFSAAVGFLTSGVNHNVEISLALQEHARMNRLAQAEEEEYLHQRKSGEWQLDKEKIRRFNELKKRLLDAAWVLTNKYNIPDSARITDQNLDQFYTFISEKDPAKALRLAKRMEENFKEYPPFWYYYGVFALTAGNRELARSCFDKFEQIQRPILRKDPYAVSNARYKMFALGETEKDEAKRLLEIIDKQGSDDDWNSRLFAALQYYQLGEKAKAEELIQHNIDLGYDVPLNEELLRQIKDDKVNLKGVQNVVIREFREPSELEKLAESGNAEAQFLLGETLFRNDKKSDAEKWLEKSANQGDLLAKARLFYLKNCSGQKNNEDKKFPDFDKLSSLDSEDANLILGEYYENGCGVKKDSTRYFEIIKKVAEQGYARAQNNLGLCYHNGIGTSKNDAEAFSWFKKSAEQGYASAQTNLGFCYENGIGTQKNEAEAFAWYKKAAEQGNPSAQANLGTCFKEGIGTQKNMTEAVSWFKKAAELGNAGAQNNLGFCYQNSIGTQKNDTEAFTWYKKAADQGNAVSQFRLGEMYFTGNGAEKNFSKAFAWYKKAADKGLDYAQYQLGVMYLNGYGINKDYTKAFDIFKNLADQGMDLADIRLGDMYIKGQGVTQNLYKAFDLYKKSAEKGFELAQLALGTMYAKGHGTKKDLYEAKLWWQKAAAQGNQIAKDNLKAFSK